jgi:transcription initiation factor TFIIE subunit alpha
LPKTFYAFSSQQNVMPSWHTKSTITGELTALGHAAASHAASTQLSPVASGSNSNAAILESLTNPGARAATKLSSSSNAAILSGLGQAPNGVTLTEMGVKIEQDVKPLNNKHSDCMNFSVAFFRAGLIATWNHQIMTHIMHRYSHLQRKLQWIPGVA